MGFSINDRHLVRKSGFFDPVYYLLNYPDVRIADIDPLKHFMKFGWKEGRNPSESFNTMFYLNTYPDIRELGINPLVHYLSYGRREGRKTK